MKIVNNWGDGISSKGFIFNFGKSVSITLQKSLIKGDWWDDKFISVSRNPEETSNGFSVGIMRVALFIGWENQ